MKNPFPMMIILTPLCPPDCTCRWCYHGDFTCHETGNGTGTRV